MVEQHHLSTVRNLIGHRGVDMAISHPGLRPGVHGRVAAVLTEGA
jgi:hypothetical protein